MPSTRPDLATELYAEIALYLSKDDLVALGRASLKLNGVANHLLYTRIAVDAASAHPVETLLLTLRDNKTLADLPRHMELHWSLETREQPKLPAALLAMTLPTLTNLTYLSVSPTLGNRTRAFDVVVLPSLVQFHSYGSGRMSTAFLDRHPRLTHLTLCQNMGLRSQVKCAWEGLVYLRISYQSVAEELLKRLRHPKLKRVVFGRYIPMRVILSCMEFIPMASVHLDMRWAYGASVKRVLHHCNHDMLEDVGGAPSCSRSCQDDQRVDNVAHTLGACDCVIAQLGSCAEPRLQKHPVNIRG